LGDRSNSTKGKRNGKQSVGYLASIEMMQYLHWRDKQRSRFKKAKSSKQQHWWLYWVLS